MRTAFLALVLLLAGCSSSPKEMPRPTGEVREPGQVHFHLVTANQVLGGYTMLITFDETVVEITDIEACKSRNFPPGPHFSPGTFRSGQTVVSGMSTRRTWHEGGEYHLFTVTFRALKNEKTRVQAVLKDCFDLSRPPQPIKAELRIEPSTELDFTR